MILEVGLGTVTRPDGVKIELGEFVDVTLDTGSRIRGTFDDINFGEGTIKLVKSDGSVSWILASTISDISVVELKDEIPEAIDRSTVGYKCGEFFAATLTLCVSAAMIAGVLKFIFWLF